MPSFSLDANVLIYAVDHRDPVKHAAARQTIVLAGQIEITLTMQVLGEFFHAVGRKRLLPRDEAARAVSSWLALFKVIHATPEDVAPAMAAAVAGRFSYWDALMLGTASRAGCTILFSEDMADGATFGPLTVRNPFGPTGPSPAFVAAISGA
jgi:predicted nucleic acid-binding protein